MTYYDNINNGEKYQCDKCQVVNLSEYEYEQYIQYDYHYCELCWNYLHLKKGECECGNMMTSRNEYPNTIVKCSCGEIILLEVKNG